MADSSAAVASTPDASAAVAQSGGGAGPEPDEFPAAPGVSVPFSLGAGVRRAGRVAPYERKRGDPIYRPLRIYTLDAAGSRLEGGVALVNVPYETLTPGPCGAVFEVDNHDGALGVDYQRLDLDDPGVLIRSGLSPTPSDPRFHQQMVYAVCSLVHAAFKTALGRDLAWGFDREGDGPVRLRLRPYAGDEENAFYDERTGELRFGYFRASGPVHGRNLPGGFVFTSLSHDIVAHEVTHALLDGLRQHFNRPTGPDVLAFHEAFADLVAIFQHFSYKEVVLAALRKSRGQLSHAELLTGLARQFGHTTGSAHPLRSAIDETGKVYDPALEPHELGSVLVSAVFEAFDTIFQRKTERYLRLATGGSGVLQPGELPADLQGVLAEEASRLASQFLSLCIRAIDYCPPVGLEFGHYLRAVITADYDLVPHDPWGYREAWIDAFARRRIYPGSVTTLSEDSLRWSGPSRDLPNIEELSFARLQFKGDPGRPASPGELRRQARDLGQFVARLDRLAEFGLMEPGEWVGRPCVESIRSARRVGPDGQIVFDLVAEVTQRRTYESSEGELRFFWRLDADPGSGRRHPLRHPQVDRAGGSLGRAARLHARRRPRVLELPRRTADSRPQAFPAAPRRLKILRRTTALLYFRAMKNTAPIRSLALALLFALSASAVDARNNPARCPASGKPLPTAQKRQFTAPSKLLLCFLTPAEIAAVRDSIGHDAQTTVTDPAFESGELNPDGSLRPPLTAGQTAALAKMHAVLDDDMRAGAVMRKYIANSDVGGFLYGRTVIGSPDSPIVVYTNAVRGFVGLERNTQGLDAGETIGALGLDYETTATGQFTDDSPLPFRRVVSQEVRSHGLHSIRHHMSAQGARMPRSRWPGT